MTISHYKYWWQFIISALKQATDSEIISQRECLQTINWKKHLEKNIYLLKNYQERNKSIWLVNYLLMNLVFRGGDY